MKSCVDLWRRYVLSQFTETYDYEIRSVSKLQNDAIPLFFNIRNLNVSHHIQEIQWFFFTQPVFFLSLADEIKLLVLAELCILSERRIILF